MVSIFLSTSFSSLFPVFFPTTLAFSLIFHLKTASFFLVNKMFTLTSDRSLLFALWSILFFFFLFLFYVWRRHTPCSWQQPTIFDIIMFSVALFSLPLTISCSCVFSGSVPIVLVSAHFQSNKRQPENVFYYEMLKCIAIHDLLCLTR